MKRMISGMIFLFIVICFIIYCFNDKEPEVMESTNERMEWETTLTDEQIKELNDYFKALTIIHFQDYERDEESTLQLLNFGSQLLQLEYPAMVEPMWRDEEAYVSFDKRMLLSIIDQYFDEKVTAVGIYSDLGDYIVRPDIKLKTDNIYPQFNQCQLNEDGTYTIDINLYETKEKLDDDFHLTYNWQTKVDCHQVGAAIATFYYEGSEGYLLSYHPIYFDES